MATGYRRSYRIVTSQRKLKKQAQALGLTHVEFQLVELLEEVLDKMRWMQVLAYSNQYLLNEKLEVGPDERDHILAASTRAVDEDQVMGGWRQRLEGLKAEIANIQSRVVDGASPAKPVSGRSEEGA